MNLKNVGLIKGWENLQLPEATQKQLDEAFKTVRDVTLTRLYSVFYEYCQKNGKPFELGPIDAEELAKLASEEFDFSIKFINRTMIETPAGLIFSMLGKVVWEGEEDA